jgi:hypothetical protein
MEGEEVDGISYGQKLVCTARLRSWPGKRHLLVIWLRVLLRQRGQDIRNRTKVYN